MGIYNPFDFEKYAYRDRPLIFRYEAPELAELLGLPSVLRAADRRVRDTILTEVCLAAEEDKWMSYSRHEGFYTSSRYRCPDFTYTRMMRVVAQLVGCGIFIEDRAIPGQRGWQSRLKASSELYQAWINLQRNPIYNQHGEVLVMRTRGKDGGKLLDYRDTQETLKLRRDIAPINEMLGSLTFDVPGGRQVRPNLLLFERHDVDGQGHPIVKQQHVRMVPGNGGRRMYSKHLDSRGRLRFDRHGRLYCWMQNIPSQSRRSMSICGESVEEIDYSAHHSRLAYSLAGVRLDRDPYNVGGGFERKHVKAGTVIAFNAANRKSAALALANNQAISPSHAEKVIDAIFEHNEPIRHYLCNDAGVELMHADSCMMMGVAADLTAAGIPSIPIHDSLIVPTRFAGVTECKMDENWHKVTKQRLNPCVTDRK